MKVLSRFLVSAACLFYCFNAQAQSGPKLVNLVPPSPNAQAFQKYGDIPISAYTGVPNISIPLYTIKFRDISVPISLSYHASGIKVAEEASQVGLGWVINTGGVISRNIIGHDDLQDPTYFNGPSNTLPQFDYNTFPRDYVNMGPIINMISRTGPQTRYLDTLTTALSASPPYDFGPDQYYYNFPGHDGKFIMTRAKQAVLQKQERIAISLLQNGTANTWEIKSTEGYIYDFNQVETYHSYSGQSIDLGDHISAWYLTKITSAPQYQGRKNANLEKIIDLYKADTIDFRSNILSKISSIAGQENVKLTEVPVRDPLYHNDQFIIQRLNFEGDYFSLIKIINRLQSTKDIGMIRAIALKKTIDLSSNQKLPKLVLEVYLEIKAD